MSMTAFTKLFASITASTIWCESHATRIVWVTMLAMADRNGYVAASVPGLAAIARVTVEEVEEALTRFLAPDKYSRSKEHEGRRIAEVDGGWVLLNYAKYRAERDAEARREKNAGHQRAFRARKLANSPNADASAKKADVSESEHNADADADADAERSPLPPKPHPLRLKPLLEEFVRAEFGKLGTPRQGVPASQWLEACQRIHDALEDNLFPGAQEACQALAKAAVGESMRPGGKLGLALLQVPFSGPRLVPPHERRTGIAEDV